MARFALVSIAGQALSPTPGGRHEHGNEPPAGGLANPLLDTFKSRLIVDVQTLMRASSLPHLGVGSASAGAQGLDFSGGETRCAARCQVERRPQTRRAVAQRQRGVVADGVVPVALA